MQIDSIWVSQRKVRDVVQVVAMQIALSKGQTLPPVTIAHCEDGSYQLEDGHHRLVAYWLSGVKELHPSHFFTVEKDQWKPRFGHIENLLDRIFAAIRQ